MKKLFTNKKGIIDDMMFWIIRIFLIFIIVASIIFFVNSVLKRSLDSESLEVNLVASRIMNSKYCLAFEENIEVYSDYNILRSYPGKIKLDNFKEDYLKKNCVIQKGNQSVGAKITIDGYGSIFINKEYYEDTEPLTFSTKYVKVKKNYPVIVLDNNKAVSTGIEVVVVAKKR